jgi:hypothetical protein
VRSMQGRLAGLSVVAIGTLSLAVSGASSSSAQTLNSCANPVASASTLAGKVIVSRSVVNRFFPEVTQRASTGPNPTAVCDPSATRIVIYANADGSKKVTLTVDQYRSVKDAQSAYQQAVQGSLAAPGFKPAPSPKLGQQAFAGTSMMGGETHFGLGALDGRLIVGATLAGYNPTPDPSAKLLALARLEDAAAKKALGAKGSR